MSLARRVKRKVFQASLLRALISPDAVEANPHFLQQMAGKLRRFYLVNLRKKYVRKQQSLRRGSCKQCGICCTFGVTCSCLTSDQKCRIHSWKPLNCRAFPIDEKDLNEVRLLGGECGFYFEHPKGDGRWVSENN